MKVYVVTYSDYDANEIEKVYSNSDDAIHYVEAKREKRDKLKALSEMCCKCQNESMSNKDTCKYAKIKEDRYGLYCESSFDDASYGESWNVIEKEIE